MASTSISTGSSADYYRDHGKEHRDLARDSGNYFVKGHHDGEPPPLFLGRGLEAIGVRGDESPERADEIMDSTWSNLAHAQTGERLGSAPRRYASVEENLAKAAHKAGLALPPGMMPADFEAHRLGKRDAPKQVPTLSQVKAWIAPQVSPEEAAKLLLDAQKAQKENVAFYDLTQSPDKSFSVYHVAAERAGDTVVAEAMEQSLIVGAKASVAFAEDFVIETRLGHHGPKVGGASTGRRERVERAAAAACLHHSSREGDPQDHVHLLVHNRVQCADGKFRAVDGAGLYDNRGLFNIQFSRAAEVYLRDTLGLRFEPGNDGRRIAGVDEEVCALFSKRTAVIMEKVRQWAERWERRTGAPPDKKRLLLEQDRIAKKTRPPKRVRDRVDAVASWSDEADERGRSLDEVYESATSARNARVAEKIATDEEIISQAVEILTERQTTFSYSHVSTEIDRLVEANVPAGMDALAFIDARITPLVERLLERSICLVPQQLIDDRVPADMAREDGRSAYLRRGGELYVDPGVLERERSVLDKALTTEASRLSVEAATALIAGQGLGRDQAAALVGLLSSGRSVEVLIGPAGTGKSFALSKLAEAWPQVTRGRGRVVGLTVSQNAAEVLRSEGFECATNLSRWLQAQERIAAGQKRSYHADYVVRRGDCLIVDEASMVSTSDLYRVLEIARAKGAKVVVTGDHRQLPAISEPGVLTLLAEDPALQAAGAVYELTEVRRFVDPREGTESLRLREGDAACLDWYASRGRIVMGTEDEIRREMVGSAVASLATGRVAALSVESAERAAVLSMQVRAQLIAYGMVDGRRGAVLHDGTEVSVGDLISARKNDFEIKDSDGSFVANRDLFRVKNFEGDGTLIATRLGGRHGAPVSIRLPKAYVRDHVELAYATTVHGAQGRTVHDGLFMADLERTSAEDLYVGLTRGRLMNRVYIVAPEGNERSATDLLSDVLERRSNVRTATEVGREQEDATRSLARLGPVWDDAVSRFGAAEHRAVVLKGFTRGLGGEASATALLDRVMASPAAPAFWAAVSTKARERYDVADMLASTITGREVASAEDVASVLHYRLMNHMHMAWEPARREEAAHVDGAEAAVDVDHTYLERSPEPVDFGARSAHADYARRLARIMDARVDELGQRTAAEAPAWATKALGEVPAVGTNAYEDWTQRAGAVAAYLERWMPPTMAVDAANPIGRAPRKEKLPQRYDDWVRADAALGHGRRIEMDVTKLGEDVLAWRIERWNETLADGPAHVSDEKLQDAHRAQRSAQRHYDLAAERARISGRLDGRGITEARDRLQEAQAKVDEVIAAHDTRARWYDETAEIRAAAAEAREELARRLWDRTPPVEVAREDMDARDASRHDRAELHAEREAAQRRGASYDDLGLGF